MNLSDLNISRTTSTPEVRSNALEGTLRMSGDSYPENSFEFFQPVFSWTQRRLAVPENGLRLELSLVYLNTSSIKAMLDIFDLLDDAHKRGQSVSVLWYFDPQNERVAELADEFKEDCNFPFDILPRSE